MTPPVAVVGGGAWGTALANAAAATGAPVVLWMRDAAEARRVESRRVNERRLPGVPLAPSIAVTADPGRLPDADAVLLVVPTQSLGPAVGLLAPCLGRAAALVVCAKGIERASLAFPSAVVAAACPGARLAALSGPSFARDVARGMPTAVTLASRDLGLARALAARLSGPALRVYHSDDLAGVEIGGAAKNVLAIAVGVVAGRGLGESARAALTARGFAELMRFAAALGARPETLMGLSGLGDLVLTCGSPESRNFALGLRLGAGAAPAEAIAAGPLAEGAYTADALVALAGRAGIEMPIAEAVASVLAGRITVEQAAEALMSRPLRAEA